MTTGRLTASMDVTQTGTDTFTGGPNWAGQMAYTQNIADGVAADQADLAYMQERAVTTGADDDIDLSGVITDIFGNTITAAELVAVMIINAPKDSADPVNTTDLTIGGAANPVPGFGAALASLKPGGVFYMAAADAAGLATVTAATGDILRVTNSAGATANYQIGLLMRSA